MRGTPARTVRGAERFVRGWNAVWRRVVRLKRECLLLDGHDVSAGEAAIKPHLAGLYWEVRSRRPSLVVEIGTRGGTSTAVLVAAVSTYGGAVLSVDPEPTPFSSSYRRWRFVQAPGQHVARELRSVARDLGCEPRVDFWLLDSSHEYEETCEQLERWSPTWGDDVLLALHDTNMRRLYRRPDGTLGLGWQNQGGVRRAVCDVLAVEFPREAWCVITSGGWLVRHCPYSSGFTYLTRGPGG